MERNIRLSASAGRFVVDGRSAFLLADTVWSALSDATDEEWRFYVERRSRQGFNGALLSVLPILHDRSGKDSSVMPFDEDRVTTSGIWELNPYFFERMRQRLDTAAGAGIVCGLVLLWVNYVEGSWGSERTPGFEMPAEVQEEYLAAVAEVVQDGECLLVVSGDAGFTSAREIETYQRVAESVRRTWPKSVVTFHSAPTAILPHELEQMANALVFQSGHHGESPTLARELAGRYSAIAGDRPVMNAEPSYEAHRVGGGVGRFGRATVRRRTWESVVGGASAGVSYGAHGLWGWHRGGSVFTSVHFSGTPLDWREALFLPGANDAADCRRIMEAEGLCRFESPADALRVIDEGWGADEVVIGLDSSARTAAVYLPNGGPVTLRAPGPISIRRVIDLGSGTDVRAICAAAGSDAWVVDPPATVSEAVLFLGIG